MTKTILRPTNNFVKKIDPIPICTNKKYFMHIFYTYIFVCMHCMHISFFSKKHSQTLLFPFMGTIPFHKTKLLFSCFLQRILVSSKSKYREMINKKFGIVKIQVVMNDKNLASVFGTKNLASVLVLKS